MNGILLVDKPADWTSHDVVAKLRGVLGERRMGHSGTLDPMATGLLVVFAGRATRAVSFSENHSKCYEARLRLGLTTDTQDTTGTVLSRSERAVNRAELEAVLPPVLPERVMSPAIAPPPRPPSSAHTRHRHAMRVMSRFCSGVRTVLGFLGWCLCLGFSAQASSFGV